MKRVICKSGIRGYRCRLRRNYSSFEEFQIYAETYSLHSRLGFTPARSAWTANPMIEGSVVPSDYRRVRITRRRMRA